MVGPINLDEIRPGRDAEVLAERDATRAAGGLFEPGDRADFGLVAVGTDDPAGTEGFFAGVDLVAVNVFDDGLPVETDTESEGPIEQELVKLRAGRAPVRRHQGR